MKSLNLFYIFAACTLLLSACNSNGGNSIGDVELEIEKNSDLTPGQHQQKLEDIAIEFINHLDANDTQSIVESIDDFTNYLNYFNEDEIYYAQIVPTVAEAAANLSPAKFSQLITRATTEDFVIDPNSGEMNPLAGYCYTFNTTTFTWDKTAIDSSAIRFCWGKDSMEITWTNSKRWEWTFVEEGERYVIYVPANIKFSLKIDGKEHIGININSNHTDNYTYAPEGTLTVNGGYKINIAFTGNVKGIGAKASISKNKTILASGLITSTINDFTNLDNWVCEYYDDWDDQYYTYLDPSEYFAEHIKTGAAQFTILDFSIIASGDFNGLFNTIETIEDSSDSEEDYYKRVCSVLNEKIQAVAAYVSTKEKIADIVWQTRKITYEEYDYEIGYYEYYYYTIEPIIVFPDDSKFAFEDFFTARAFSSLIDAVEEFAISIENLAR